jgi:hypothetical protein
MEQISARAALVSAPELGDGLSTTISRSEIEEALAADEAPIELVLDLTRFADGEASETRNVAVAWERADLERLLAEAQGDDVVLTFDRETLSRAMDEDVEAHGIRETALVLAVAATAAAGGATAAAAQPGPQFDGAAPIVQSASPDDRAFARAPATTPAQGVSPDDRAVARGPATPEPSVSPDDRAFPRVATPEPGVSPDDRAFPRVTPETPTPVVSPDDRAFPRTSPPPAPVTGTTSDPGTFSAPSPETVAVAGALALLITGAFFLVGTGRRRVRPI